MRAMRSFRLRGSITTLALVSALSGATEVQAQMRGATGRSSPMPAPVFMALQGFLGSPVGADVVATNPPLQQVLELPPSEASYQALGPLAKELPAHVLRHMESPIDPTRAHALGDMVSWAYEQSRPAAHIEIDVLALEAAAAAADDASKVDAVHAAAQSIEFYGLYGRRARARAKAVAHQLRAVRTQEHARALALKLQQESPHLKLETGPGGPVEVDTDRSGSAPPRLAAMTAAYAGRTRSAVETRLPPEQHVARPQRRPLRLPKILASIPPAVALVVSAGLDAELAVPQRAAPIETSLLARRVYNIADFRVHMEAHIHRVRLLGQELLRIGREEFRDIDPTILDEFLSQHDLSKIDRSPGFLRRHHYAHERSLLERIYDGYGVNFKNLDSEAKTAAMAVVAELNRIDHEVALEFFRAHGMLTEGGEPGPSALLFLRIERIADWVDRGESPVSSEEFARPMTRAHTMFDDGANRNLALELEGRYHVLTHGASYETHMYKDRANRPVDLFRSPSNDGGPRARSNDADPDGRK